MRREVEAALASRDAGSRIPFAIYHRGRSEHIGSTSLWNYDAKHRSIEIGSTWLGLAFHGMGINRECKDLLFGYAFNDLGVNRVALQTDSLNLRSRRAIEKLGAQFEGIRRHDLITWAGRVRSSAYYSLLGDEWRTRTSGPPVPGRPETASSVLVR